MIISASKLWWIEKPFYRLTEAISNFYYNHHEEIYICSECGLMEAPYTHKSHNSLPNEFGWKKLRNPKRWICHHCAEHSDDESFTKEEWKEYVIDYNSTIKMLCDLKPYSEYMGWK